MTPSRAYLSLQPGSVGGFSHPASRTARCGRRSPCPWSAFSGNSPSDQACQVRSGAFFAYIPWPFIPEKTSGDRTCRGGLAAGEGAAACRHSPVGGRSGRENLGQSSACAAVCSFKVVLCILECEEIVCLMQSTANLALLASFRSPARLGKRPWRACVRRNPRRTQQNAPERGAFPQAEAHIPCIRQKMMRKLPNVTSKISNTHFLHI